MNNDFQLFPDQASVAAAKTDQLYFFLLGTAAFFTTLICLLILYFAIRYRRGARITRQRAPSGHLGLEIIWSAIPFVLMMVSFTWGAKLYVDAHQPPRDAIEVYVVAKQWMWKIQHAEGRQEINQLHVPVGQPVRLKMISEDVIHSFFIPAFRLKQDVLPGRYTGMWFEANKTGEYHLFCAEYCGTSHSLMRGRVYVQEPNEFAAWLAERRVEPPEEVGRRLFERFRCDTCHKNEPSPKGPPLQGLMGRNVSLQSGRQVTADLPYLRRAILDPKSEIVAGYDPLMPTYQGQITEEELLQIAAYIKALTDE